MTKSVHQTINASVHGNVAGGNITIQQTIHHHGLLSVGCGAPTPTRSRCARMWCMLLVVTLLLCAVALAVVLAAQPAAPAPSSGGWPAPTVPLRPVTSSAIVAMGYDPITQQLYIVFTSSPKPYTYCAVPAPVFDAFMAATSKGAYFHQAVRGRFGC